MRGVMQQNNMVPSTFRVKITCQVPQYNSMSRRRAQKGCVHVHKKGKSRQSQKVSLRSLKRMSCDCPTAEELPARKMHKTRVVENDCRQQKVDAVDYERGILVDSKTHSLDGRTNRHDELDCVGSSDLAWDDSDSVASSVGSCSDVSSERESFPGPCVSAQCQSSDSYYTRDPKPFCALENNGEIHRLELRAYRSTLAALHASGPLSWDKEALLTNLRSTLHISNDEHLMELRDKYGDMQLLLPRLRDSAWFAAFALACAPFLSDEIMAGPWLTDFQSKTSLGRVLQFWSTDGVCMCCYQFSDDPGALKEGTGASV